LRQFQNCHERINDLALIILKLNLTPDLISINLNMQVVPNHSRNPILLVHGLMDTSAKMRKISSYLHGLGWEVWDINLTPNNGDSQLEILAQQVADLVDRILAPEQSLAEPLCKRIDLLGFSMGGLVSRYYLQRLGGLARVQRFISISAPNHGTVAAYFSLRPGCIQMRPDSDFIKDLNRDIDRLNSVNLTTLWTPFDLIILPPTSSQIGIGTDISIPVLAHPLMVSDQRTLNLISTALSQPIKASSVI
jgi:triacylglycerol lipase